MNAINSIFTAAGNVVFAPMASWSPAAVLIVLSVVSGVAMTAVFRYTSNQAALRRVAKRTKAQLQCMKLFKDDLGVALRCQRDLLKYIGLRLWYSVPPMLVLIVPFVLILTQLAMRYENRPLEPGESVVAAVQIAPDQWKRHSEDLTCQVPAGVTIQTPPLRDAERSTVYWRLGLEEPTSAPLVWRVGNYTIEKSFAGAADADRLCTVNTRRPGPGFWDRLLRPAEPGFDAGSPVQSVDVRFPARSTPLLGLDVPWWGSFIIISMVAALIVRPFFKVQF